MEAVLGWNEVDCRSLDHATSVSRATTVFIGPSFRQASRRDSCRLSALPIHDSDSMSADSGVPSGSAAPHPASRPGMRITRAPAGRQDYTPWPCGESDGIVALAANEHPARSRPWVPPRSGDRQTPRRPRAPSTWTGPPTNKAAMCPGSAVAPRIAGHRGPPAPPACNRNVGGTEEAESARDEFQGGGLARDPDRYDVRRASVGSTLAARRAGT